MKQYEAIGLVSPRAGSFSSGVYENELGGATVETGGVSTLMPVGLGSLGNLDIDGYDFY